MIPLLVGVEEHILNVLHITGQGGWGAVEFSLSTISLSSVKSQPTANKNLKHLHVALSGSRRQRTEEWRRGGWGV